MTPSAWRASLLALCALTASIAAAEFFGTVGFGNTSPWLGIWGATVAASSQPFALTVRSVDAHGAAARAGVLPGDLIDIRANALVERFSLLGQGLAGRSVSLAVRRGSLQSEIAVTPDAVNLVRRWDAFVIWPGIIWMALFAALIAWRRSQVREMRLLCLVLATFGLWWVTSPAAFAAPWSWAYVLFAVCSAFGPLSLAFWATCAACFAAPPSRRRRVAGALCYGFVGVSIALALAKTLALITLWFDPVQFSSAAIAIPLDLAALAALASTLFAISASAGAERQRAAWLLVPPALLFAGRFALETATTFAWTYEAVVVLSYFYSCVIFVTPVILTYAALSRRLIDIGFVLNRTAVFAAVSTIVIGAFILIEWGAGEFLGAAGHHTSAAAAMLVALLLGFSVRYIHTNVDRFIDHVFFRKRHDDELALRRFAHEASYITDRTALLDRAVLSVERHTGGAQATIFVHDLPGTFAPVAQTGPGACTVGENDPAIVALLAWHKPLDLESYKESALSGRSAYPMIARGTLVGILVCGTRADGEPYAPDESDALFALAHGLGAALAGFSADRAHTNGSPPSELANLRHAFEQNREDMRHQFEELRAAIEETRSSVRDNH